MRKTKYLSWIDSFAKKLLEFQDAETGCFYPRSDGKTNYTNARWQEGVLTLAWLWNRKNDASLKNKIIKGISLWCSLQHRNGSFPEYSKWDVSFSATAFSTIAVAETASIIGTQESWLVILKKAGDWLVRNDEFVLINQEAAAALALLKVHKLFGSEKYLRAAEKKIDYVLSRQDKTGFYPEKSGFDFGYSSLTLEMLGHCYALLPRLAILASAEKFLGLALSSGPNQKNVRSTDWAVIDGFEIFSGKCESGPAALKHVLENFNVQHMETEQNICTDLYRLCWAHDNVIINTDCNIKETHAAGAKKIPQPSKLLNLFRPFGLHRVRRLLWQ